MVLDIAFIGRKSRKAEFAYTAIESFAYLPMHLPKTCPSKPELGQVTLQEFCTFKVLHASLHRDPVSRRGTFLFHIG
jgi:hypothetical protein